METNRRYPIIWLAQAYIFLTLIVSLLALYRIVLVLIHAGAEGFIDLVLNALMILLLLATTEAIRKKTAWGQRLGIISFSLLGVFATYGALIIFMWPASAASAMNLSVAKAVILIRMACAFILAVTFAVSKSVELYFNESDISAASLVP